MYGAASKAMPSTYFKCTNCDSIAYSWAGRCESCGEWNTLMQVTNASATTRTATPKRTRAKKFKQEVSRQEIMLYLQTKSRSGQPIKIYYKDDKLPTIFHDYTFNSTYLFVPSGKGFSYKYLIERIRSFEQ